MHAYTNDLINETSPYLLQHAHNPVNWHAWSEQNLEEAQELGKPLLISIGYSSCHWCHVMEHESFEDEEVATYMNEHFYCIKVDREERPDVDQIYMTAANIITGSGGWPLNCFALPDGRPFHAGTYFPKNSWMQIMKNVDQQFNSNRENIIDYAEKLTQGIRMQETAISDNLSQKLTKESLDITVESWKSNWDLEEGGMDRVPKFPMPINYEFLLKWNALNSDEKTNSFIDFTLRKMAMGGIFDQIGGGFARYSTDGIWKAPHFEKMLYDNAQLMKVYSLALRSGEDQLYSDVLSKTKEWLKREMLHSSGLFYSALDADSEGEEGKFYVWTEDEIEELLGDDFNLIKVYYQIGGKGLWEHENNILLRDHSLAQISSMFHISEQEIIEKVNSANAVLLAKRDERIRPGLDDKCLTSWNGLMLEGLAEAYKSTGDDEFKQLATKCADAIIKNQIHSDGIWHSFKDGKSTINGMLEDYSFVGTGMVAVYEITGDEEYYQVASSMIKFAIDKFYDGDKGLFYFNEENELIVRTSEVYDNVIPSTNAAMAHLLTKMGLLDGNPTYLKMGEELIGKVQENLIKYPGGHAYWMAAQLMHTQEYYEIAVIGPDANSISQDLFKSNISNALIVKSEGKSDLPIFRDRFKKGETLIYVCQKGACQLPVKTVNEAVEILNEK